MAESESEVVLYRASYCTALTYLLEVEADTELHVIADFDLTLTRFSSVQCHDAIGLSMSTAAEYREMKASYHEMSKKGEMDTLVLREWWDKANAIISASDLTQDFLNEHFNENRDGISLRHGVPQLLQTTRQLRIPTIIASAGIKNVIEKALQRNGVDTAHDEYFYIDSNEIHFSTSISTSSSDGSSSSCTTITHVPAEPLTSLDKHLLSTRAAHMFRPSSQSGELAAIILGDREQDFEVCSAFPSLRALRFGFAKDKARGEELLAACCDCVIIGRDTSVEVVLDVIDEWRRRSSSLLPPPVPPPATPTTDVGKWEKYYEIANISGVPPPWESSEAFSLLKSWVEKDKKIKAGNTALELGCGASASACYLASKSVLTCAVDVSPLSLERARRMPGGEKVNWVLADLLTQDGVSSVPVPTGGGYDFVFDMQCYHVLREIDAEKAVMLVVNCLKKGGVALVVVGADEGIFDPSKPGPPRLSWPELVCPFIAKGLSLEDVKLLRFNATPAYEQHAGGPPCAWAASFRKKIA